MLTDPYAESRFRAARQSDVDLRRDEPWLWHFANVLTWAIHPWMSLRLWWLERQPSSEPPSNPVRAPLICRGMEGRISLYLEEPTVRQCVYWEVELAFARWAM